MNINSSAVRRKFRRDIKYLEQLGVKYLRLDAVAYAGKRKGTSNFLLPQTINFITWLAKHAHCHNMRVIPEVHHHYKTQISLAHARGVDYVYDFALPFLMLNAIFSYDNRYLTGWLRQRPDNSISNLDTHDGIGVIDVKDLLPADEIQKTSEIIYENGGRAAMRASGTQANNLDVYQINCAYYSALGKNDNAYIAARAIQLFLPGIPQIYYVGFLAGANDEKLFSQTKNGRDINRHYYSLEEIESEKKRPVVQRLFKLCRLRNTHPAFAGSYSLEKTESHIIKIAWTNKHDRLELIVNLKNYELKILQNKKKIINI